MWRPGSGNHLVSCAVTGRARRVPQFAGRVFLGEAGLETDLLFNHGIDLPDFAAFPLLATETGRATLSGYCQSLIDLARRDRTGVVLETATWRANPDWGVRLGYSPEQLDTANRRAVTLLLERRAANPDVDVVVSGTVGPRGDGYAITNAMSRHTAAAYHRPQIASLHAAGADLVSAFTMNHVDEATGIVDAAQHVGIPVVISFTVETDGRLPSGQALAVAIDEVDAATDSAAAYFMVNCAHPSHFADVFDSPGPWDRVRGIRANASRMSHAELDNASDLDRGDAADLAERYVELAERLPQLSIVGGCCGTDLDHLSRISAALDQA
jgi:S-methylmethionine-dependent homocysteine/selenocysteine methylase